MKPQEGNINVLQYLHFGPSGVILKFSSYILLFLLSENVKDCETQQNPTTDNNDSNIECSF